MTTPSGIISFGDFRLDRRTRQLRYRGAVRRLRAKSSAVLLHLAEHPDRLVTHAEVSQAVWPDTKVSSTVLRVCIREIRVALDPHADRFLTTIPRRGHRFTLGTSAEDPAARVFVGRASEMASLHEALARARDGRRQVVVVGGESGVGKTALLEHFLEEVRAAGDATGARGQSIQLRGRSEGCAAVLDLLNRLCDEADGDEVVRALHRSAPGWLLQLPARIDDGAAQVLRARDNAPSWEGRLLELSEALEGLARTKPLVLVLEDLHWSDASTIDALVYLLRRSDAASILVVVSHRPGALESDHPLVDALHQWGGQSGYGSIWLDGLARSEVGAYLQARFGGAPVAEEAIDALSASSAGHPADLVRLVDHLVGAERLRQESGVWRLDGELGEDVAPRSEVSLPGDGPDAPVRPAAPVGERRQLTVLCCNLVGSMELARSLDPEDLRDLVRQFQESASQVVRRYEGHVAQYLVDGLVVYFGYPRADEDSPVRAARAGLEILASVREFNRAAARAQGVHLDVRVGIHSGRVVMDEMGGEGGALALGAVPHVAAEAQAAAPVGQLFVTGATEALVTGEFVVERSDRSASPDGAEGLPLYRVLRASGARRRAIVEGGRLSPFVGREDESAILAERFRDARAGEGRMVLLQGEAGIGKSRLVYEFRQALEGEPHTWLESGATPYTATTFFRPIVDLVGQGLAVQSSDPAEEQLAKIEAGLGAITSRENVALISELLGLSLTRALDYSAELIRQKTIELLAEWAPSLATAGPVVLAIEDLHWCDPSTLELLGHLAIRCHDARLMILVTARPEFTPGWEAVAHCSTVTLGRLAASATKEMVREATGELSATTVDALVKRSDGVPLFAEELAQALSGPTGGRADESVPATLADSLMGRLDRLGAAKEVAQLAAVLGREFDYALLAAVTTVPEAALRLELGRLVEAGILFVDGEPPEAAFAFKHALIQETAYESLLKGTRREQHARIARTLEKRFPQYVQKSPEVIARHFDLATQSEGAVRYYRLAADRAADRCANEEAIQHLERALQLVEHLPETRDRHRLELEVLMSLAHPLSAARGWTNPEYAALFHRARKVAAELDATTELPRLIEGVAAAALMSGDVVTSLEIAHEALAAAEETGDTFDLMITHVCVGTPLLYLGDFAGGLDHLQQGVGLYDPADQPALGYMVGFDRGIAGHAYAAVCELYLGRVDRAVERCEEALALARNLGHPLTVVNVLSQLAIIHFERRDFGALFAVSDEAVRISTKLGFPFWMHGGSVFRGAARVGLGDHDEGVTEINVALGELAAIGNGIGAPAAMVVLAEALCRAGRKEEAAGAVALGLASAEQTGQDLARSELQRLSAETLLHANPGAVEQGESELVRALEVARRQGAALFELRAACGLARLWRDQGKGDAAREVLDRALAPLSAFDLADVCEARALRDELSR